MCTAITYKTNDHYFGRNLDLEDSFCESITITPRNFPLPFRAVPAQPTHQAMIGMAYIVDNYPLYYDATNESGLSMAGLNFPDYAVYHEHAADKDNIAPFELIPWVLGQCRSVAEVYALFKRANLVKVSFSEALPLTPLHWFIADRNRAITVECTEWGLQIHENPIGVLTNAPSFDFQMLYLSNFMSLNRHPIRNRLAPHVKFHPYSRGMGAIGLPGDLSSTSRFVKAAFTKLNSVSGCTESESISQFFHILGSAAQQRGCVQLESGLYERTIYSSCCNTDKGIYYYTTYDNSQITGVDMYRENLDSDRLIAYPLLTEQRIRMQN